RPVRGISSMITSVVLPDATCAEKSGCGPGKTAPRNLLSSSLNVRTFATRRSSWSGTGKELQVLELLEDERLLRREPVRGLPVAQLVEAQAGAVQELGLSA